MPSLVLIGPPVRSAGHRQQTNKHNALLDSREQLARGRYVTVMLLLLQWRTEEGARGLEPLPLVYDLRNKRVRMLKNMVFSTKKYQKFSD